MVMQYSINNVKKKKTQAGLSPTAAGLARQVAGQQLKPVAAPAAAGAPQITPFDTQTGRQERGAPGGEPFNNQQQFKRPELPGDLASGRPDRPPPGRDKNVRTVEDIRAGGRLNTSNVKGVFGTFPTYVATDFAPPEDPAEEDDKIMSEQESTDAINRAISDLLREQTDVAAEREAMLGEMRANEAQGIQALRARAGLGGMGLTGATAGLESQARTQAGRAEALTTAQFDRQARDEALRRLIQGIQLRRGEDVYQKASELYDQNAPDEGEGGGLPEGANVDDKGNIITPPGGYDPSNPPPNALIPAKDAEAWRSGYNDDPATVAFYKSLPESPIPSRFPGDKVVDSYIDDGKYYYIVINSSGQYYRYEGRARGQATQPRKGTRAIDRAKRTKQRKQNEAAAENE